jgi:ClpP class serine protease
VINAFDVACAQHWLILPEALEKILAIANRDFDADVLIRARAEWESRQALATQKGTLLDGTRTVDKRSNGVAVVPVVGPIMRYSNIMTDMSGAQSLSVFARDFASTMSNPMVNAIVLNFDTPGGDARGINEGAAMIAQAVAQNTKPILAYAGGTSASAGYWLMAAVGKGNITVDPTAVLGSIGVVATVDDTRERDAKTGKRTYEIVSSNAPNKRPDVATDAGRAQFQAVVDQLEQTFIGSVAQYRGVSTDVVKSDFGRGGLLVGEAAVKAGMADHIGSLESTISRAAALARARSFGGYK